MKKYFVLSLLVIFSCTDTPISDNKDHIGMTINQLEIKSKVTLDHGYFIKPFSTITYLGNDPSNQNYSLNNFSYMKKGAQGLANDGINWFFSNKTELHKWHKSHGFPSTLPSGSIIEQISAAGLNNSYDHYCDLDFDEDQELIYVSVETTNSPRNVPPLLLVYDKDLNFVDSDTLSKNDTHGNRGASWVSLNPITKEIYTSKYNNVTELWIYEDTDSSTDLFLQYRRSITLQNASGQSMSLEGIQGGEFSKSGHLFLLAQEGPNGRGIYVFNINTADDTAKFINYKYMQYEGNRGQEFEGLTVWDLDSSTNDGGFDGQVHALTYQKHIWYGNKFWLKHYRMGTQSTEVITPIITGTIVNNKPRLEWDNFGAGYSYEIFENNTSPNGDGITLIATTSSNNITVNKQLENPFILGGHANIYYYVRAKKNGLRSSPSNTVQFSIEYDISGGGSGCEPYIICPGDL